MIEWIVVVVVVVVVGLVVTRVQIEAMNHKASPLTF